MWSDLQAIQKALNSTQNAKRSRRPQLVETYHSLIKDTPEFKERLKAELKKPEWNEGKKGRSKQLVASRLVAAGMLKELVDYTELNAEHERRCQEWEDKRKKQREKDEGETDDEKRKADIAAYVSSPSLNYALLTLASEIRPPVRRLSVRSYKLSLTSLEEGSHVSVDSKIHTITPSISSRE
jgi:hypothetical protein